MFAVVVAHAIAMAVIPIAPLPPPLPLPGPQPAIKAALTSEAVPEAVALPHALPLLLPLPLLLDLSASLRSRCWSCRHPNRVPGIIPHCLYPLPGTSRPLVGQALDG